MPVYKSEDNSHMTSMNQDHYVPRHPNHSPQMTNQIQSKKQPYENSQQLDKTLLPFSLSFKKMFERLINIIQIILIPQNSFRPPYLKWYEPDLTCEYYGDTSRHNIEDFHTFKDKFLQFIKAEWITFEEALNVSSKVVMAYELGNGSQIRNLVRSGLIMSLAV